MIRNERVLEQEEDEGSNEERKAKNRSGMKKYWRRD
jgi:hypothetical protein